MLSLKPIVCIGALLSTVLASAVPATTDTSQCGKYNFIFTGLPPTHPAVAQTGFDPAVVGPKIQADVMEILAAGYNIKGVLMGPEIPIKKLSDEIDGFRWDGAGVGYGLRGPPVPELTIRFEDVLELYRTKAPQARFLFNHSPESGLWAIKRRFPITSNCTDSPGKLLGLKIFCDICPPGGPISLPGSKL